MNLINTENSLALLKAEFQEIYKKEEESASAVKRVKEEKLELEKTYVTLFT